MMRASEVQFLLQWRAEHTFCYPVAKDACWKVACRVYQQDKEYVQVMQVRDRKWRAEWRGGQILSARAEWMEGEGREDIVC